MLLYPMEILNTILSQGSNQGPLYQLKLVIHSVHVHAISLQTDAMRLVAVILIAPPQQWLNGGSQKTSVWTK